MSLSDDDRVRIDSIDEPLRAKATEYFLQRYALTEAQKEQLEKIRDGILAEYVKDLNKTYTFLHELIDNKLTHNTTDVPIYFHGNQPTYGEPTLNRWYDANQGAADAFFLVIDELEQKGWTPQLSLSETFYDSHDCRWCGGSAVIFNLGVKQVPSK